MDFPTEYRLPNINKAEKQLLDNLRHSRVIDREDQQLISAARSLARKGYLEATWNEDGTPSLLQITLVGANFVQPFTHTQSKPTIRMTVVHDNGDESSYDVREIRTSEECIIEAGVLGEVILRAPRRVG
jgi:hypothetical protein